MQSVCRDTHFHLIKFAHRVHKADKNLPKKGGFSTLNYSIRFQKKKTVEFEKQTIRLSVLEDRECICASRVLHKYCVYNNMYTLLLYSQSTPWPTHTRKYSCMCACVGWK